MGLFVTFEGPEGSGKTTQVRLLYASLVKEGLSVVRSREPGGTCIGEQVRAVLHDLGNQGMLPITEALLYSAARAQHVSEVIGPALERDAIVLCDRFAESTFAYQGYGHGLDLEALERITRFATGGLRPDLVVYLDLDVDIGLQRKLQDRREGKGEWNRMDQQSVSFHRRVREGYLTMARQEVDRWLIVDASRSVEEMHESVRARVLSLHALRVRRPHVTCSGGRPEPQ